MQKPWWSIHSHSQPPEASHCPSPGQLAPISPKRDWAKWLWMASITDQAKGSHLCMNSCTRLLVLNNWKSEIMTKSDEKQWKNYFRIMLFTLRQCQDYKHQFICPHWVSWSCIHLHDRCLLISQFPLCSSIMKLLLTWLVFSLFSLTLYFNAPLIRSFGEVSIWIRKQGFVYILMKWITLK